VDTDFFCPGATAVTDPVIIFTGDMSYFPNQDAVEFFALDVLPRVREAIPEARFLIVGRNPGPRVRSLREHPNVEVAGFVPDIREYLHKARLAVAPFRIAAGIQNKILEAMACGLPVVATTRAVKGLSNELAAAVDTAAGAEDFAGRIISLFTNPEVARSRGIEARRRAALYCNWDRSLAQLLELIRNPSHAVAHA
jgi:glycosyltransferase involved in cell wall biosynthesis